MPTILLETEAHELLVEKQKELKKKYKTRINIPEIATIAIKGGIDKVESEYVKRWEEMKEKEEK